MEEQAPSPGCLMPIAWAVVSSLLALVCVVLVVSFGMNSESEGMSAAYMASGPLGFALGGGFSALIVHFLIKAGVGRILAPFGCGCLGAIGMGIVCFLFFAVIFPAL